MTRGVAGALALMWIAVPSVLVPGLPSLARSGAYREAAEWVYLVVWLVLLFCLVRGTSEEVKELND